MNPFGLFVFIAVVVFSMQSAGALEGAACPVSDKEFLHQITSSGDWSDVYAVFKRNIPACQDEGLYADGYTNLVVGVLAARWFELDQLAELMAQDNTFKQFVLRHIGISAGEDDLRRVLHSAQTGCPAKSLRLCKEIAARCKHALSAGKN